MSANHAKTDKCIHRVLPIEQCNEPAPPTHLHILHIRSQVFLSIIQMSNNGNDHDTISSTATTATTTTLLNPGTIPVSPFSALPPPTHFNHFNDPSEASCSSCLWTGVITCMGLSVYFAHIAFEDDLVLADATKATTTTTTSRTNSARIVPTPTNYVVANHNNKINSSSHIFNGGNTMRTWFHQQFPKLSPPSPASARYNKPVFLCISAGWFVVGLYRWHLG